MRISDWSSDVCSSDLAGAAAHAREVIGVRRGAGGVDGGQPVGALDAVLRARLLDVGGGDAQVAVVGDARLDDLPQAVVEEEVPPADARDVLRIGGCGRSEEHTSELQSLMRISYAVFCLKKKKKKDSTDYRRCEISK